MNNINQKGKSKFNMINTYIVNINRLLKGVKSKISANYIHSHNKLITSSNLNIVKKYMKELNDVDLNNIISLRLL